MYVISVPYLLKKIAVLMRLAFFYCLGSGKCFIFFSYLNILSCEVFFENILNGMNIKRSLSIIFLKYLFYAYCVNAGGL
jgi:hypothetical protein